MWANDGENDRIGSDLRGFVVRSGHGMAKPNWKYVKDGEPSKKADGWAYLVSWCRCGGGICLNWEDRDVCEALWNSKKGWVLIAQKTCCALAKTPSSSCTTSSSTPLGYSRGPCLVAVAFDLMMRLNRSPAFTGNRPLIICLNRCQ